MGFSSWLGAVFSAAFDRSIDTTQIVIFIAIVAVEAIGFFLPSRFKPAVLAMSTKLSTGRIALVILIGVIGTRLVMAPYWVWEDEHTARMSAEQSRDEAVNKLSILQSQQSNTATQTTINQRSAVLAQLRQYYILSHDNITPRMAAGMEWPPQDWLNGELENRGEKWRVRVNRDRFETYNVNSPQ
jgi:hypothetical protein